MKRWVWMTLGAVAVWGGCASSKEEGIRQEPPDGSADAPGATGGTGGQGGVRPDAGEDARVTAPIDGGEHGGLDAAGRDDADSSSAAEGGDSAAGDGDSGDVCSLCTEDLSTSVSLECFCRDRDCPESFADSVDNWKWTNVAVGCGYVVLSKPDFVYGLFADQRIFDMSGRLVGGLVENHVSPPDCFTPLGDSEGNNASGGALEHAVEVLEQTMTSCPEARYCALASPDAGIDAGGAGSSDAGAWASLPSNAGTCSRESLLALFSDGG